MRSLDAVRETARALADAGVPSPRVDAELLVAHVSGVRRSALYAPDGDLSPDELEALRALAERRRRREPLAYVLGEWGFRRLTLAVDPRVLVPRPETETVVERCLVHLAELEAPRVLDVGVGSGAIALALADEHLGVHVTGVDASRDALAVARANLERLGLAARVALVHGEGLARVCGPFDLVVSNPPYVPEKEVASLEPEIREHEPREAIVEAGLGRIVAADARAVLRSGGWLVLECSQGDAGPLGAHLADLGYEDVAATRDYAGIERVVEARWP